MLAVLTLVEVVKSVGRISVDILKRKSKIVIVDDYIGTKTLHHLSHSKKNVKITVISDNVARPRLSLTEYNDFITENPGRTISFLQSMIVHMTDLSC
jgi:hypothetical protein